MKKFNLVLYRTNGRCVCAGSAAWTELQSAAFAADRNEQTKNFFRQYKSTAVAAKKFSNSKYPRMQVNMYRRIPA
jgi:hypothetical protein